MSGSSSILITVLFAHYRLHAHRSKYQSVHSTFSRHSSRYSDSPLTHCTQWTAIFHGYVHFDESSVHPHVVCYIISNYNIHIYIYTYILCLACCLFNIYRTKYTHTKQPAQTRPSTRSTQSTIKVTIIPYTDAKQLSHMQATVKLFHRNAKITDERVFFPEGRDPTLVIHT